MQQTVAQMNKTIWKKALPHLIAIAVFLVTSVIMGKSALETGVSLRASDQTTWQGMAHQTLEYKKANGTMPLWTPAMFSGMPAFQVAVEGKFNPILHISSVLTLGLPEPINFFFLACICFYFLGICLGVRPYAAVLGALAFAFCTYNPIIITAGHNTKMLALAYAPAVIGACILIFNKKYLLGFTFTAVLTGLQIAQGHQQISYYLFFVLLAMSMSYIIRLVKGGEVAHLVRSLGIIVVAGVLGLLMNAVTLFPTYDYAKESKRGGQLVMDDSAQKTDEAVKDGKTAGLSKDYAFQWSYGKAETMSLMFPGVMGYGNHQAQRDGEVYSFPKLDEEANAVKFISEKFGAPTDQAVGYASGNLYWGKQPFTNGPVYLGAIVCFLFIMGMFYLDGKHKWWAFASALLGILLALGSNLPSFNYFMFDHFPLYNKFRVPTMALVIPQLVFPIVACLFIDKLVGDTAIDFKKLKLGGIITAAVFALALGFYASTNFGSENKMRTAEFNKILTEGGADANAKLAELNAKYIPERDNQVYEGMVSNMQQSPTAQTDARAFVNALHKDRASVFLGDVGRSFIYILLAAALIFAFAKRKLNATILMIGMIMLTLIDLLTMDSKYLNSFNYDSSDTYEEQAFPMRPADKQILADKDLNYRVFDMSGGDPFQTSNASYYHKSIGGNHAAKLGIYDDLAAYQLSGNPNTAVLNMLNTKYVIQQQGEQVVAATNPGAMGNVWFVKNVKLVDGPMAEMKALTGLNPRDSAVADKSFAAAVGQYSPADSTSSIEQTKFDFDEITYQSKSSAAHIAVFSEVYYKDWKAYIDGKEAPIFKANYVLRALNVPAGDHTITFKFEPAIFYWSDNLSAAIGWVLAALILFCGFVYWRKSKKEK